jgi:phytanoyl-CoA hydroxylase
MEEDFTTKAKASGMTDEEAKYAFNRNMMSTGFLDSAVRDFGRRHNRRWLLSEYEAGDVVLHTPYMIHASTINHDPKGAIRLGTDLRYVDKTSNWDTRWNNHFRLGDGV